MTRAWPVPNLDPDASLAENARRILAVKLAEFYAYAPIVADEHAIEELHDMRIATKRLRYTLELFRPVFGKPGQKQIERVKALQEELGEIHDHDVRIALIEEELAAVAAAQSAAINQELADAPAAAHPAITAAALRPPPDDPRRGLLALLGRQHAARRNHHRAFLALWRRHNAAGMRATLAELSAMPLPDEAAASSGR